MALVKNSSGDFYYAGQDNTQAFGTSTANQKTFTKVIDSSKGIAQIDGNANIVLGVTNDYKLAQLSKGELIYI